MPVEKCISLLKERLHNFKINLEDDIISIMTDGASVMKKFGKFLKLINNYTLPMLYSWQLKQFFAKRK